MKILIVLLSISLCFVSLGCITAKKHELIVNDLKNQNKQLQKELDILGMEYQKATSELESIKKQKVKLEAALKEEVECGKVRIIQYENQLILNIDDKICFPSGSAKLGKEAQTILFKIVESLNEFPNTKIFIEGNTDNVPVKRGSWVKDNWELSAERAVSVTRFIENKINPARISVVGNAWFNSIVPNTTEENKKLNRRVDIIIVPN